MSAKAVLSIDQGTTGTRAILYDRRARVLASSYQEFPQHYPKPGWVEHDPEQIWRSTVYVIRNALAKAKLRSSNLAAIGITNQRETTVLWDCNSGEPIHPAIVWQDRRTADFMDGLRDAGQEGAVRRKTGLVLDPYFSASKLKWLLDHVPGARSKAKAGNLRFGTIDSWLLWKLTGGDEHRTDCTNASRTLLYNIRKGEWDQGLLKLFDIPESVLPHVMDPGAHFGKTKRQGPLVEGIPITAMIGDQQAALYGQSCYQPGEIKNTYGTGCFVVLNLGKKFIPPPRGLLETIACDAKGRPVYALEGAIFIAGAAIQWLRDGLGFFKDAKETEKMATSVQDTGGVVFIPAFAGLGSPHWNAHVRGNISGLTRGTERGHIVRAALESIAHQTVDVVDVMEKYSVKPVRELRVDGGATKNGFLMQVQADLLGMPVLVSDIAESTAWGAGKLAGRIVDFWTHSKDLDKARSYRKYTPKMNARDKKSQRTAWGREIRKLVQH